MVLVVWAAWLSRVVTEMPALGLGYPPTSGLMAFVENFVPILNLLRVPAIVRDVVRRLDPAGQRGTALISAAWLGIFGGFLLPRVGGLLNVFGAGSLERRLRNQLLLEGVSTGLVVAGAVFLVVLIWWIERQIARHRTAQVTAAKVAGAQVPRRRQRRKPRKRRHSSPLRQRRLTRRHRSCGSRFTRSATARSPQSWAARRRR